MKQQEEEHEVNFYCFIFLLLLLAGNVERRLYSGAERQSSKKIIKTHKASV